LLGVFDMVRQQRVIHDRDAHAPPVDAPGVQLADAQSRILPLFQQGVRVESVGQFVLARPFRAAVEGNRQ
jgi:hypothetical protein